MMDLQRIFTTPRVYTVLAVIPVLIWLWGFTILASSPYMGMKFEYRDGNYYIAGSDNPKLNNKKIIAVKNHTITGKELTTEPNSIWDRDEHNHFWETRRYLSVNINPNQPVDITIDDNGPRNLSVTPSVLSIPKIISATWLNFLTTLVITTVGWIVAIKKNSDSKTKIFFLGTLLLAIHNITIGIYDIDGVILHNNSLELLMAVNTVSAAYTLAALLYFYLIFPREYEIIKNQAFKIIVFWIIPLIISILFIFRINAVLSIITVLAYITAALAVSLYSYSGLRSPVLRNQAKWVLLGMTLLILGDVFLYIIPLITGRPTHSYYFLALFPILATVFAISRYRLMDIDTLFDYAIIYSVTIGLLSLIDIGIVTILANLGFFYIINNPIVVIVILVWITIFAYVPLRDRIYRLIQKLFKRGDYDINQLSLQLQHDILMSSDVRSVVQSGIGIIEKSLHPKKIEAIYPVRNDMIVIISEKHSLHLPEIKDITNVSGIIRSGSVYENYPEELVVPIKSIDSINGYFILQNKQSGTMYGKEDKKLLAIIAGQVGLALNAIEQKEKLQKEKERISREIHDGIGSSLTQAILISENMSDNDDHTQNKNDLAELKNILNTSLDELRELIWTVENKDNTVDDLVSYVFEKVQHIKNQRGFDFKLRQEIEKPQAIISPKLKLNLIRVIQESVTNIIKHADASKASLVINQQGMRISVTIEDNGIGFEPDMMKKSGYGLRNMKNRIEELGGSIVFTSAPQQGTKLEIMVPLE